MSKNDPSIPLKFRILKKTAEISSLRIPEIYIESVAHNAPRMVATMIKNFHIG